MADEQDIERNANGDSPPNRSSTTTASSSSSPETTTDESDSSSPPITPPTDEDEPEVLPRIVHAPHSNNLPRRGGRRQRNGPSTRLGAIDEDTEMIAPDIPNKHPDRRFGSFRYADAIKILGFNIHQKPKQPPPDLYDGVTGPRGEKFSDIRSNKPYTELKGPRMGGKRRIVCIVVAVVIVLAIALGVGLGVGLNKKKKQTKNINGAPTSSSPNDQQFPFGTYAVGTYLTSTNTNCTTQSSTFTCFPGYTYNESTTSSFSTLLWLITSPTNSSLDLQISATDPTFSYPFTNVPITIENANDVRQSAFAFTFQYRKQVSPSADIFGDGSASRCYFNNTSVAVKLYNNAQGAGGGVVGAPAGATQSTQIWPYAVEFEESVGDPPQCFKYNNGVESDPTFFGSVNVDSDCSCDYRNYGL